MSPTDDDRLAAVLPGEEHGVGEDGEPHTHETFPRDHPHLYSELRHTIIDAMERYGVDTHSRRGQHILNDVVSRLVRVIREGYEDHGDAD